MTDDELAAAWPLIKERLSAEQIAVFRALPDELGVEWPDDDWATFLDVAVASGTRLVYAECDSWTPEQLDNLAAHLNTTGGDDESLAAVEHARAHGARPCRLKLGFPYGGIVHSWIAETDWSIDLDQARPARRRLARDDLFDEDDLFDQDDLPAVGDWAAERAAYQEAYDAETARVAPQVATWVAAISTHPEYLAAASERVRRTVAERLHPELSVWTAATRRGDVAGPEEAARRHAAWQALRDAEDERRELREEREATAKAQIDDWVADLREDSEFRACRNMEERKRRTTEFVTCRLGFNSASVRDKLLALARS
jgi:hypothetical protein